MRNFRDRVRSLGSVQAMNASLIPGPKTENIKAIIERSNYSLEVTVGQRKFHNPPDHDNTIETSACVCFIWFKKFCMFRFILVKFHANYMKMS